jgi:O-methyltransferase involved in polyketide biosynthesis
MVWLLKVAGEIVLDVRVAADMWYWLGTEAADPLLVGCDPYADARLDAEQIARWREAIDRVAAQLKQRTRADLEARRRLPQDPAAREQLLDAMVAKALARDPRAETVAELAAALDLARESGATIEAIGD